MESQFFENIMDSAILLDKAGRIINWNNGAINLFGYTKKEALGWSVNFIYERHYPFPKLIHELSNYSKKWHEETVFVRKNGMKGHCKSYLCSSGSSEPNKVAALLIHYNISQYKNTEEELYNAYIQSLNQLQHSITGFWSASGLLHHTIGQLEQMERKLRESELSFHLLAENATDIISRHSPDGAYLYVSPACKTTLGYHPELLIGKNIYKFIHHDDLSKLKKAFIRRKQNQNNSVIYRIKRKDGEFRWFESNVRLISDEQDRYISEVQLASRDITDRVLDKKARLRGQQLAHVFRLSTMEEMASGMAHEISQPLAALVNYTRGCARHLENSTHDPVQLKNIMDKAVLQAERAGEIIQRLKNFFCKGQLVKTPCKIHNVIRETLSFIKNEITISKTKVDLDVDKNIPLIYIDKIQIQQVILNLTQNAIEAMQENNKKEKRIYIKAQQNDADMIEITIRDTGPGFSKEMISKVFKPFFSTKAHGRGMGLAICRSIIEAHGGEFTINPNTNQYSWIRFSLPILT